MPPPPAPARDASCPAQPAAGGSDRVRDGLATQGSTGVEVHGVCLRERTGCGAAPKMSSAKLQAGVLATGAGQRLWPLVACAPRAWPSRKRLDAALRRWAARTSRYAHLRCARDHCLRQQRCPRQHGPERRNPRDPSATDDADLFAQCDGADYSTAWRKSACKASRSMQFRVRLSRQKRPGLNRTSISTSLRLETLPCRSLLCSVGGEAGYDQRPEQWLDTLTVDRDPGIRCRPTESRSSVPEHHSGRRADREHPKVSHFVHAELERGPR